jgi:hypothetical protein
MCADAAHTRSCGPTSEPSAVLVADQSRKVASRHGEEVVVGPDDQGHRISRRGLLGGTGAAVGLVWARPALKSLPVPSRAGTPPPRTPTVRLIARCDPTVTVVIEVTGAPANSQVCGSFNVTFSDGQGFGASGCLPVDEHGDASPEIGTGRTGTATATVEGFFDLNANSMQDPGEPTFSEQTHIVCP